MVLVDTILWFTCEMIIDIVLVYLIKMSKYPTLTVVQNADLRNIISNYTISNDKFIDK